MQFHRQPTHRIRDLLLVLLTVLSVSLGASALAITPRVSEAPTLLLLSSDTAVLAPTTGQARITAMVRAADGTPLTGIEVTFRSDQGSLTPAQATTNSIGSAEILFTADDQPGRAYIQAAAGDQTDAISVQITGSTGTAYHGFTLNTTESILAPGQQSDVTIILTDAAGQPISGAPLTLIGSGGDVSPVSGITDARGRVDATFTAGQTAGTAHIAALSGYATASTIIRIDTNHSDPQPSPVPPTFDTTIYLPLALR